MYDKYTLSYKWHCAGHSRRVERGEGMDQRNQTQPAAQPKGKHLFGLVKVGEKGQIVIPKQARDIFDIRPGDQLLMLGDEEQGLAILKADRLQAFAENLLRRAPDKEENT